MTGPTSPTPLDPPPPSWLRAAGLVFLVIVVGADVFDGRMDADPWSLVTGLGVALWGPSIISALRSIRSR
ncbi:MAG: hypothetical protein R2761_16295 [Acidimicrobiales bacterium]